MTCHPVCNKRNTTGVTRGTRTAYPSGRPEFTPVLAGLMLLGLQFSVEYLVDSLIGLLYFFLWSLYCLLFFDLRRLITSLLSLDFA